MSKPVAVIISDVHYSLPTLALADAAMRQAITKANDLQVPLIIAGDLHDTKANMRAECVNAMIKTFKLYRVKDPYFLDAYDEDDNDNYLQPYVIVGNHCKVNEKSEEHSLNFLEPYANIIDRPQFTNDFSYKWMSPHLIPYHHDTEQLRTYLKTIDKGSLVFMHQGIIGADLGDYIQDKTAIPKEWCAGLRVISGHYHARQDIICPDGGLFSYVGNPYTLSFGEANDPPKGFRVLHGDGLLEFIPTALRTHRVLLCSSSSGNGIDEIKGPPPLPQDLVWVKLTGTKEELLKYDRQRVAKELGLTGAFKLDLIPLDSSTEAPKTPSLNQNDLLDSMIDSMTNTTDERKTRLKSMWKDLL